MITDGYLRINEIKNTLYCPRISYYLLCLQLDRTTDLSEGGIRSEQQVKRLMQRRKTALHAVHDGDRLYDVALVSHRHRLVGRIDEIVETASGVYLVDYKDTERDYGYWQIQMTAYRLAAVEMGMTILGCYVYTIPTKAYHLVSIGARDEKRVADIVANLLNMVEDEKMPPPVSHAGKCRSCQYQNYCGDVL